MANIETPTERVAGTVRTAGARVCRTCQTPIAGKATKRFCGSRCKAEFHRRKKAARVGGIVRNLKDKIAELEDGRVVQGLKGDLGKLEDELLQAQERDTRR